MRFFLVPDGQKLDYIESDGTQYIKTDFYPDASNTTISVDFYQKSATPVQQRVFGTHTGCGLVVQAYINGSGGWSWSYSNNGNWTSSGTWPGVSVTATRTQILLDGYNDKYTLTMGGAQKYTCKLSSDADAKKRSGTPNEPLYIFAHAPNADQRNNMKLYSLVCSRSGTPERNFEPYVRKGAIGLRDSVTGTFYPRDAGNMFVGAPSSSDGSPSRIKFSILRRRGFSGTGSSPPFENGLHLSTRQTASAPPIATPHSRSEIRAYSEQVGQNLHDGELFAGDRNLR